VDEVFGFNTFGKLVKDKAVKPHPPTPSPIAPTSPGRGSATAQPPERE
jgi:hypothetical protein